MKKLYLRRKNHDVDLFYWLSNGLIKKVGKWPINLTFQLSC